MASSMRYQLLLIAFCYFFYTSTLASTSRTDEALNDEEEEDAPMDEKPEVTGEGQNITIEQGDTFNLTCPVDKIDRLPIYWNFNGKILIFNDWVKIEDMKLRTKTIKNVLQISKAMPSETGQYDCVVGTDPPINITHHVTVISNVRMINLLPEPITLLVNKNENLKLICDIKSESEQPILWTHQKELETNSIEVARGSSLRLLGINMKDNGTYSCMTGGKELKAHIIVLDQPALLNNKDETIDATVGQDVTLSCKFKGNPTPNITWHFKERHHPSGDNKDEIMIANVKQDDAGTYLCRLNNDEELKRTITLRVQHSPQVVPSSKWVHAGKGRTIDIGCVVIANPVGSVDWFHNGSIITSHDSNKITKKTGNKYALQIRDFKLKDFGNYTCDAKNTIGRSSATITISGLAAPVDVNVSQVMNKSEVAIVYKTQSYSPISFFRLRYRNVAQADGNLWIEISIPAQRHQTWYHNRYFLSDLQSDVGYELTMLAENEYGWNQASTVVEFMLPNLDYTEYTEVSQSTIDYPLNEDSKSGIKDSESGIEDSNDGFEAVTNIVKEQQVNHKEYSSDVQSSMASSTSSLMLALLATIFLSLILS